MRIPDMFDITQHGDLFVVILEEAIQWCRVYMKPHPVWDFMHEYAEAKWVPCVTNDFDYLNPSKAHRTRTLVICHSKADAVNLVLRFEAVLLGDFKDDYIAEKETDERIDYIRRQSREERRKEFPGLDALLAGCSST